MDASCGGDPHATELTESVRCSVAIVYPFISVLIDAFVHSHTQDLLVFIN